MDPFSTSAVVLNLWKVATKTSKSGAKFIKTKKLRVLPSLHTKIGRNGIFQKNYWIGFVIELFGYCNPRKHKGQKFGILDYFEGYFQKSSENIQNE